ncbi:cysteine-rich receptor-like protein kinase 6 isoform X3 [Triticum urartu]|uniref:cysteine-rich receptor-like protein kinase 6 isoform X3 n=1 Tax=Triticum urartu TaxID=4572 RepID=UPI0020433552|nr:cysteine-rich receptor-like protein kinase 6 isoform X3 [Triticum urartu]
MHLRLHSTHTIISTHTHRETGMAVMFVAIVALLVVAPRAAGYPWPVCGSTGSFAANDSTYLASINSMAATLPRNASTSPGLYATAHAGQVWALALCRGDANATSCSGCLAQGFQDLPSACAYSKEATMYYDTCFLHYSNLQLSASDDTAFSSAFYLPYSANATDEPARFDRVVAALLNATADYAAYNSSGSRPYASGVVSLDQEFPEMYSWAQCTPDLTRARCRDCLVSTIQAMGRPLYSVGARVLGIRCGIRYESRPFLDGPVTVRVEADSGAPAPAPTPPLTPAPAPAPALVPSAVTPLAAVGEGRKYSVPGMVLIIGLAALAAANLIAIFFIWRRRQRPAVQVKQPSDPSRYSRETEDSESVDSMLMDISTLRAATGDFAENNKLGEGGFGAVYMGTLPDGEEIAVKRLSKGSTQGVDELMNELALVAKLKHKNLVRLVGVCLEQQERLLVYEFVPNRSLDQILFIDVEKKREQLDWGQRLRIIRGIARGLQYLHEDSQLKVVHRDLKASNVLLDVDMNPKISDFGLARLFERGQTQGITNRVIGTYGYMAPEYMMRGKYSVKSDVFSFGVMVLEIVTGRKNNDTTQSDDLLTMIWEHWTSGTVLERMDQSMDNSFSESDVMRCIQVGLLCVQENPVDRPVMSEVGMMLESDMVSLGPPSKPASGKGFGMTPTIRMSDGPQDQPIY